MEPRFENTSLSKIEKKADQSGTESADQFNQENMGKKFMEAIQEAAVDPVLERYPEAERKTRLLRLAVEKLSLLEGLPSITKSKLQICAHMLAGNAAEDIQGKLGEAEALFYSVRNAVFMLKGIVPDDMIDQLTSRQDMFAEYTISQFRQDRSK